MATPDAATTSAADNRRPTRSFTYVMLTGDNVTREHIYKSKLIKQK